MIKRQVAAAIAAIVMSSACATPPNTAHSTTGPALWMAHDEDTTLFLFGTIHTLTPEDDWRAEPIMRAFSESDELYLEIEQIGDPNFVVPIIREHGIDRDVDLSDRLPPGCREQLAPAIQEYGFDTNSMARLRPWVATLTLGQAPLVRAGYDLSLGVDVQLKSAAAERGMPVHGLETAESQVLSMATLSDNMQIALLCSLLDGLPTVSAQLDRIRRSWLAGDLSALDTHVNETTRQEYPEFYEAFIVVRNRGMAERMQDRMAEPGRVFVAVGAAHLVGSDSVQRFLSGAGVEVERVH